MSGSATYHTNLASAFRQKLLTLVKATTGTRSDLSISSGKFVRAAGSFLADGFGQGDEVLPSGFGGSSNILSRIKSVTDTVLEIDDPITDASAIAGCAIVASLPNGKAWETETYFPTVGKPYVSDAYNNLPSRPVGLGGMELHTVQAIFTLYYPQSSGRLALSMMAGLVRAAFRPKFGLFYGGDSGTLLEATVGRIVAEPDWNNLTVTARAVGYTAG